MKKIFPFLLSTCLLQGCYRESVLLVKAGFTATVAENSYTAPVRIQVENASTGADFYRWTFEGGSPASSTEKEPGSVIYSKAGAYIMKLEVWNDTQRDEKTFAFTVDSTVHASFETELVINDFVPAHVKIVNTTRGASSFRWIFEGGTPAVSVEQNPGEILFTEAGEHLMTLEAGNGRETFTVSRIIILKPPLSVDFDIEPSFDDFDYEAPFTAALQNKTLNGLTYTWSCDGATIDHATEENATLHIASAGTYIVTLTADNGQEVKTASREIAIGENMNLYAVRDMKFGIRAADNTVGCGYSLLLRKVFKTGEMDENNGSSMTVLFWGLNDSFDRCFFVSPDHAGEVGFYEIPGASETYIVNKTEESGIAFASSDFDAMNDDELLRTLDIKSEGNTTGSLWFDNTQLPRFVLFEADGGIKGVIKIKAFVSEGNRSYILTDIKHQKTAR
ncbi:MAG: PKD domain-containing protein [Bacteroidales bacterium]|jgi:PKD repeat protein|nr:PKD domain-containing protein [Bacteroidales bacterium]